MGDAMAKGCPVGPSPKVDELEGSVQMQEKTAGGSGSSRFMYRSHKKAAQAEGDGDDK